MSGYIIGLLPVFLLVMMMIISPDQVDMFFSTRIGNILLAVSAVMEGIGFAFVRKIIGIKF
jgi:tight adherence protein B